MKFIFAVFCLLIFTFPVFAQKTDDVLATAANKKFTAANLKPEVREMWLNLPKTIADARRALLQKQIDDAMLELEADARKITVGRLIEIEVKAKVPAPANAEIQAVYDANRARLGNVSMAEIRPQIIAFLRREPEQKVLQEFIAKLKTKYKTTIIKDVNAPNLKAADALATVGTVTITVQKFENKNALKLYEAQAEVFDAVSENLKAIVASELLVTESVEMQITPSRILAREITDKLREYTEEEREELQAALDKRLFAKYKAEFLIKEPKPVAQKISADDDPSQGSASAPVTVVMFSDFQCSFCAAAHPALKKVLAEYAGKARFVVRDFPLETIHADAFRAALAANAARAQGKFFEYIEVLYRNQNALDTDSLKKYAVDLGLNLKQFELDLGNEKTAAEIRKDMADGALYGITGTPTIFVNGVKVRTNTAEGFRNAIEKALK